MCNITKRAAFSFAQVTGVQLLQYTGSSSDVEYRTCLDWQLCHMRGAVFHHEVSSWHFSVLIELYIEGDKWIITANCGGWDYKCHVHV